MSKATDTQRKALGKGLSALLPQRQPAGAHARFSGRFSAGSRNSSAAKQKNGSPCASCSLDSAEPISAASGFR